MTIKSNEILYLSRSDVERVGLSMRDLIHTLEEMFREKGNGRTEMPPKPGIHPKRDAFIHAMPAFVPSQKAAGIKWVAGFPQNQGKGLPYIHGLLVMNDVETGAPLCVMDATWITAMRTGAATALAAKHLARPDSHTVGIVACGAQGRANLEALAVTFPLKKVFAFDTNADVARHFAAEMSSQLHLDIRAVETLEEAVRHHDLVVTSGPILKSPEPTIPKGWLKEGAFASAVDFDSYWKPEALNEIDKIVTDDRPQFDYYQHDGYFQHTPAPYAELAQIICHQKPGREKSSERTMAMNLGIGLEDVVTGKIIFQRALELGCGTALPL